MKLIKITNILKRRVKQMVLDLLPEFGFVRVTNRGSVILKKDWWSFRKTIVNITDLFIDILPNKLAESCQRKGFGDTYARLFSDDIYVMMQIKAYKQDIDIAEYIWNKYNILYREIPTITITSEVFLENPAEYRFPVLSSMSSYFIPGFETFLKRKKNTIDELITKIQSIQRKAIEQTTRVINMPIFVTVQAA
jgi:hypothetical protein